MQEPLIRADGLQLDEPREFQKRFWNIERLAWIVFALIIVLALLGFTGAGGPFSRGHAEFAQGRLDYPRIARWQRSEEFRIRLSPGEETRRVTFGPSFYEAFQVEGIEPEPESQKSVADGVEMSFAADADAEAFIVLHVKPQQLGLPSFRVGLNGDNQQFVSTILP